MKTFISQRRHKTAKLTLISLVFDLESVLVKKEQNLQTRHNSKNELLYPNLMEDFKHLARVKESDFLKCLWDC